MTAERLALLDHELRSPVAALTALAERAAGAPLPEGALERIVALAIAAVDDVGRMLCDPDLMSLRPVAVDLRDLLGGVAARSCVVVTAEEVTLVCDPTRVRQAVGNLVANGLRHGSAVVVDGHVDGTRVLIDVSDDGPGVDPAIDPFARGSSAAGSTGYGLWLARAVAEAHGGLLELVSATGQGAAFRLSLPLVAAASG